MPEYVRRKVTFTAEMAADGAASEAEAVREVMDTLPDELKVLSVTVERTS
jgi:hypothetical protein